jgi:hypothetical protein
MESSHDQRGAAPCPSDADLLCASSGELPPDEWQVIREHLEDCPACRSKTQEMLRLLQLLARYYVDADSPADRHARGERLIELMDARRADREAGAPRRWLVVAAGLIAVVAAISLFRGDRVAYADEIVARIAQREHTLTLPTDRCLVRIIPNEGGQPIARHPDPLNREDEAPAPTEAMPTEAMPLEAVQLLREHGFDPDHPLSVERLQAWRASQPDRRDHVTREDRWLVVQSNIEQGRLRQVELVIDETSYQVVKQTWLFAGIGRIVCERLTLEAPRVRVTPKGTAR